MDVFLTGAIGYIGGAIADALLRAGHAVLGLARSDEVAEGMRARYSTHRVGRHSVSRRLPRPSARRWGWVGERSPGLVELRMWSHSTEVDEILPPF